MLGSGLVAFLLTLCAATECRDGSIVLSVFGIRNATGQWNLLYDFTRDFCDSTESWRLDFLQDWDAGRRYRLRGSFRERISASELKYATLIHFGDKRTSTVFIAQKKAIAGDASGDGMSVVTREEWKALGPNKEFEKFRSPAKFVFVTQSNVICPEDCSQILRKMQKVLMACFGDVYSNFYVDDGGRTYEGLGWNRMRSKDSIYVHFLTDSSKLPSSESFASFALLLWEGLRMKRVSEEFELIENKHLTKSFQKELLRWVQWSKRMWVGHERR